MPGVGDLVHCTDGTWITRPPARCQDGHQLGASHVLVGYATCGGHGGGRACDEIVRLRLRDPATYTTDRILAQVDWIAALIATSGTGQ